MRTAKRAQPASERDLVRERVLATVDSIPREAGLPRRARLVGRILSQLPPRSGLPWHRVVNAQGALSPRGDGSSVRDQRRRLAREGVRFDARGRVDLDRHRWRPI